MSGGGTSEEEKEVNIIEASIRTPSTPLPRRRSRERASTHLTLYAQGGAK